jgi:hypothetical protein
VSAEIEVRVTVSAETEVRVTVSPEIEVRVTLAAEISSSSRLGFIQSPIKREPMTPSLR